MWLADASSLAEAEIDDWKSYYQVIQADTFQETELRIGREGKSGGKQRES
jgi:hypothetical protein